MRSSNNSLLSLDYAIVDGMGGNGEATIECLRDFVANTEYDLTNGSSYHIIEVIFNFWIT